MRLLKWISWVLAGLVVLVLLAVAVLVWVVDPNAFKPRIEAEVKQATGRDLALVGDIELGFFPWLALRSGEGRLGNAPGFAAEPMVSWRSAQFGVKLFPLLRGDLVVDRVRIGGADVKLVRRADGVANWEGFGAAEPADAGPDTEAPKRHIVIDGVDLRDSRLSFVDEAAGRRIEVAALNLTTDRIAPDEPLTDTEIAGVIHMPDFPAEGVPFRLQVPEAAVAEDYSTIDVPELELVLGRFEAQARASGKLGEPLQLAGEVATNRFDARALLTSLGIEAPKTTDPKALGGVQLSCKWKLDGGAITIDQLALTLDDTRFNGSFHRGAGEDAVGEFALRGDALDIARYIPPTDPGSEPFVLPTAMLKSLRFRGVVELERATYEDVEMKGVTLRLVLDEQGLRSEPKAPTAPADEP